MMKSIGKSLHGERVGLRRRRQGQAQNTDSSFSSGQCDQHPNADVRATAVVDILRSKAKRRYGNEVAATDASRVVQTNGRGGIGEVDTFEMHALDGGRLNIDGRS